MKSEQLMALHGRKHVERYRETNGEEGHEWEGTHTLLLTTTERRSGERRTTPLIYGQSNGDYLVVASKGGPPTPPAWCLNLSENPEVQIQVGNTHLRARARDAASR